MNTLFFRKSAIALTGLFLCLFLIVHLSAKFFLGVLYAQPPAVEQEGHQYASHHDEKLSQKPFYFLHSS